MWYERISRDQAVRHECRQTDAPSWAYGSGPTTRTDERFLARVADAFDWDELDHNCWVSRARVLMQLLAFTNTYQALTALFERDDVIDGAAIKRPD